MKKRLKSKVVIGLIFGLVLAVGLAMPLDGVRQILSVQASSSMNMSATNSAPVSGTKTTQASANFTSTSGTVSTLSSDNLSMFTFLPTTGTETDVRLTDKTVTRAIVPSKIDINGTEYTVTSVAANGFSNAPNLEVVRLPRSVKTIGLAAFMNCTSLRSVTLPQVQTINSNAFMNCSSLNEIIIPKTATTLGGTILRGTHAQVYSKAESGRPGWNATWNNNNLNPAPVEYNSPFVPEIEYREVEIAPAFTPFGVAPLSSTTGFIVDKDQPFVYGDDVDLYIPDVHPITNEPIVGIADKAFEENFMNSLTVGFSQDEITIGQEAFSMTFAKSIVINRSIIWESIVLNDATNEYDFTGVPSNSNFFMSFELEKVVLPTTLTIIPNLAFAYSSMLTGIDFVVPTQLSEQQTKDLANFTSTEIELPQPPVGLLTTIGANAFEATTSIQKLIIPTNITTVGSQAFSGWTTSQFLDIKFQQNSLPSGWGVNNVWYSGSAASIIWAPLPQYTVNYEPNQPVATSTVVGLPYSSTYTIGASGQLTPSKFSLTGWKQTGWNTAANGTGTPFSLNFFGDVSTTDGAKVTLYARWEGNKYTVTYNANLPSGASLISGGMENQILTYDSSDSLIANAFILSGSVTFLGWSRQANGPVHFTNGQEKPNIASQDGAAVTLYAIWSTTLIEIRTADDFNSIRNVPNGNYRLMANINLSGFSSWTPIPNFTGILDGDYRSIQSMNITYEIPTGGLNADVNLGLFATFNGTVKNLIFMNATVNVTNEVQTGTGVIRAGLFAGTIGSNASVTNVDYRSINAWITVNRELSEVGLFAGQMLGGNVTGVYNHSVTTFRINGQGDIGGFIGVMRGGTLRNCTSNYDMGPLVINYTRNANNRGVGLLVGRIVSATSITGNTVNNGRITRMNASGGTLFGNVAGIGSGNYGTNSFSGNLTRLTNTGTYVAFHTNTYGITY